MKRNGLTAIGVVAVLGVGAVGSAAGQAAPGESRPRPQDDFYRFANAEWLARTQVPADRGSYSSFSALRDRSDEAVLALIREAAVAQAPAGSERRKLADLYLSFMDSARVEERGLAPLAAPLRQIASLARPEQMPALLAELAAVGVRLPFSFSVQPDGKQSDRYIVYLGQGGLGLPDRDYYLGSAERLAQAREAYRSYLETVLRLAGDPDPAGGAAEVVALERRLAEAQWDRARSRDREATYNFRTPTELDRLTPAFSWSRFLDAAGAATTPGVVVRQPDYLEAVGRAVADAPLSAWRRYLTVRLVDEFAGVLSTPFVDASFAFQGAALQGLEEPRSRERRAVSLVEDEMGEALGRLYVERHFRPEARAEMQGLVDNLVAAFREGIDGLEWMGPATRAAAREKLARFTVKIGHPDEWRDYGALRVEGDDLAGNVERANRFAYRRMVDRLGQPVERAEWGMTPQTVNAYYSSSLNEIVFPAAILQPPFFDAGGDDAYNYGAIGAVIGHEISHGFDDQGRRSDGDGNLRDWWTEADNAAFRERADALVAQYDALSPLPDTRVNGRLTLGENIGDLSGLAVAYRAYRRSLGGREAPVVDGLTGDQRFFLGWARIWASQYRENALRQRLLTDPHSPGEYRVNAVVRHLPEFHAAWGVKAGDGMYLAPERRVRIW